MSTPVRIREATEIRDQAQVKFDLVGYEATRLLNFIHLQIPQDLDPEKPDLPSKDNPLWYFDCDFMEKAGHEPFVLRVWVRPTNEPGLFEAYDIEPAGKKADDESE